jgi:hypothetical protein
LSFTYAAMPAKSFMPGPQGHQTDPSQRPEVNLGVDPGRVGAAMPEVVANLLETVADVDKPTRTGMAKLVRTTTARHAYNWREPVPDDAMERAQRQGPGWCTEREEDIPKRSRRPSVAQIVGEIGEEGRYLPPRFGTGRCGQPPLSLRVEEGCESGFMRTRRRGR